MNQFDFADFAGSRRKIVPFVMGETWNPCADHEWLAFEARRKAAGTNQHTLGYGKLARREWADAGIADPDLAAMRRYRKERIRNELVARDLDGIIVYDPVNIRYATDSTNMQLWVAHNATRYCFVGADGKTVLFDYHACEHLSDHAGTVDEVRPAISILPMYAGELVAARAERWAASIADLMREQGGRAWRLAFDRIDVEAVAALGRHGISVHGGQAAMEFARSVKSADEILCMRRAICSCEQAMHEMEATMSPGMSENDLWAILHHQNVVRGGEWIETRLLASGPRTNPWFQECSSRIIEPGDLVAFDTDMIGPYGYCSDISRTWFVGHGPASHEQRRLYSIAFQQVHGNISLLKPGVSLRELWERAQTVPPDCLPNRYSCLYHGVGLCDEYPTVPYRQDVTPDTPGDDVLVAGMVLCVESYAGRLGGRDGVKLEEQVLITETGHEVLSSYPHDERLVC